MDTARLVLLLTIPALVFGADARADRKKSQTALERGKLADEAGQREAAIASYTEALEADVTNVAAVRARAQDYAAAGDRAKALADFQRAIQLQPSDASLYAARAD